MVSALWLHSPIFRGFSHSAAQTRWRLKISTGKPTMKLKIMKRKGKQSRQYTKIHLVISRAHQRTCQRLLERREVTARLGWTQFPAVSTIFHASREYGCLQSCVLGRAVKTLGDTAMPLHHRPQPRDDGCRSKKAPAFSIVGAPVF